jgi:beta-glucosidase
VKGATIFPHNLGLGAANDPALTQAMGAAVAAEMRASGLDWNFAPCVAVARDERWGRSYESFGEDPQLSSRLGAAYILGLQGTTLGPGSVVATAKHYLADGGTLGGVDRGNAVMDEAELRRIHLAPYAAAVKAGAGSVMASFSSWNDLQMHANRKLLTDVLRGELGFTGVVVSDWAAHKLLPGNPPRQVKTMVMAGVDVCMVPDDMGRNGYLAVLHELALSGEIPAARIDEAVSRILTLKFTIGLFEKPYGPPADSSAIGSPAHRQVARQLAAKSLVVLKNSQVLPVKAGTILVTGGLADNVAAQCGGWTMGWQNPTGKIEGATSLKAAIAARAKAGGMGVAFSDAATLPAGPKPGLAIVIAGERPYAETAGDRQDLRLPAADRELIRSLKKQGVPVLLLLVSGRPLVITELLPDLDGLVAAWLPGSEGAGVADVLFGDVKPSGRLPMSWPVSNEQLPVNAGDGKTALFPYGFGLGW